jgi:hypothetical protein
MDQEEDDDDHYREIYRKRWKGRQVEFMEKYGNDDVSSTSGTLSKWLNKKTLSSPKCKQAVKQFMADLENGEHNPSSDTARQLVSSFKVFLIRQFPGEADQQTIEDKLKNLQKN